MTIAFEKTTSGQPKVILGWWLGGISIAAWLLWVAIVTLDPGAIRRPWRADILAGICLLGTMTSMGSAILFYKSDVTLRKALTLIAVFIIIIQLASFTRAFFMILSNN
jgi:hypothetical protein